MTKFPGAVRARPARVAGVLAVIAAAVFASGYVVVSSLASPANPAPAIGTAPPDPSTSPGATFAFSSSKTPTGFLCALDTLTFTACTSPTTYRALSDGSHKFSVKAQYSSGTSNATSDSWKITPAAPVITEEPGSTSPDSGPEFRFTDANWPDVTFTCWVDAKKHNDCTGDTASSGDTAVEGEWRFAGLAPGSHCFSVYAADANGIKGPATRYCWTIVAPQNFTVGGDLTTPLYPGTSQPLNLTFTNPNSSPVTIPSGNISAGNITVTSNAPGCPSSDFPVTHGLTAAVTIPASQTSPVSLSALGVPQASWPVIAMTDTHTNQDACQGAKLTLTYSGIEATG
jgi:hypothetical protein